MKTNVLQLFLLRNCLLCNCRDTLQMTTYLQTNSFLYFSMSGKIVVKDLYLCQHLSRMFTAIPIDFCLSVGPSLSPTPTSAVLLSDATLLGVLPKKTTSRKLKVVVLPSLPAAFSVFTVVYSKTSRYQMVHYLSLSEINPCVYLFTNMHQVTIQIFKNILHL